MKVLLRAGVSNKDPFQGTCLFSWHQYDHPRVSALLRLAQGSQEILCNLFGDLGEVHSVLEKWIELLDECDAHSDGANTGRDR